MLFHAVLSVTVHGVWGLTWEWEGRGSWLEAGRGVGVVEHVGVA